MRSEASPWQSGHVSYKKRQSGRWGVAQGCDCRSILDAIGTLIEAQRSDLAMILIEHELNSQTSLTQHPLAAHMNTSTKSSSGKVTTEEVNSKDEEH